MAEEWYTCPNECGGSVTTEDLEKYGMCVACAFDAGLCLRCGKRPCECEGPLYPDAARTNQRVRARVGRKR